MVVQQQKKRQKKQKTIKTKNKLYPSYGFFLDISGSAI
tara:strand:+ start:382 stop:495 length:114 start_codon:yes stop_codon:yes gene_type:complete